MADLEPYSAPGGEGYRPAEHREQWRRAEINRQRMLGALRQTSARGKLVSDTYDLSTASGTQDFTGFGFDPLSGIIVVNGDGGPVVAAFDGAGGSALVLEISAGNDQTGVVTLIEDGIRVTWTKTGTPTGTAAIAVLAFP